MNRARLNRARVNRVLLGGCGAALVGGVVTLLVLRGLHEPILTAAQRTRWRGEAWWWPTVFAVLGAGFALALWWLVAQLRLGRPRQLRLDAATRLRTRALRRAIEEDVLAVRGVRAARVTVLGPARRPAARMLLRLEHDARPAEVLARLASGPLDRARSSTGLDTLPTEARLTLADLHPRRVR